MEDMEEKDTNESLAKEILAEIGKIYPVRYEKRSAIAPVLWVCGAMFTTSLIWCAVNVYFGNWDEKYIEKIYNFASTIAEVSFGIAIAAVVLCLIFAPNRLHSEHYLIEMEKIKAAKSSGSTEDNETPVEEENANGKNDNDGKEAGQKD